MRNRLVRFYFSEQHPAPWRNVAARGVILVALALLIVPLSRISEPRWLVYVLAYGWGIAFLLHALLMAAAAMADSTIDALRRGGR